jgi:putative flippase GtrA
MRFSRFVVIAGLCAAANNVLVIALTLHGVQYVAASLLAFGPVLIVGYALHTRFTFQTSASHLSFVRYALAMAANFPIWFAALYLFCDIASVSIVIAAPATTALVFVWNYASTRWALLAATKTAIAHTQLPLQQAVGWRIRWR